jgi:hypothetical protein
LNIHAFAQHEKNSTRLLARIFQRARSIWGQFWGHRRTDEMNMMVVPGILRRHHNFPVLGPIAVWPIACTGFASGGPNPASGDGSGSGSTTGTGIGATADVTRFERRPLL